MRYLPSKGSTVQPDLFHPALISPRLGLQSLAAGRPAAEDRDEQAGLSDISLNGSPRHCLQLLAPILRDLSQAERPGWLSLIDPPLPISHKWLRASGLDPRRILIIRPRRDMDTLKLCCDILELGHSHTVVSWLPSAAGNPLLQKAAHLGRCASLNIRMTAQA